jgi:hypothetical protein
MMAMFTAIARSLFSTPDSMAMRPGEMIEKG